MHNNTESVSTDSRTLILNQLEQLEQTKSIRILLAVECGSRVYGLHTAQSDYDVRVIYVHHPRHYLSIGERPSAETFALPISYRLDVHGMDLRKFLSLVRSCNATALEWLFSPIVYVNRDENVVEELKGMCVSHFQPFTCAMHYYNWLVQSWKKCGDVDVSQVSEVGEEKNRNERALLKNLICNLRLAFAVRWLQTRNEIVPLEFDSLLDSAFEDDDTDREGFKACVRQLVEARKTGTHLTNVQNEFGTARTFLLSEIDRLKDRKFKRFESGSKIPIEDADNLFQDCLRRMFDCNI